MFNSTKLIDFELNDPPADVEGLDDYLIAKALVRLHGRPIEYVQLPVINGRCEAKRLQKTILAHCGLPIVRHLLGNLLATPRPEGWCMADLLDAPPLTSHGTSPLVTVAVCTRNRSQDLALCLDGLNQLDYPELDIVIVDNAPTDEATKRLITTAYPQMRYVCEPRPGLDWARNRAIIEARGEIIAFTDDDVVVDPGWVRAIVNIFTENAEVMAVTGLVVPYELETRSQILFEKYGGFGRGFERKWYRLSRNKNRRWRNLGTGQFGTGANMAYRRSVFEHIGYFDPALDVGTVTNGGGDLEMFYRILKEGYTLVYEPSAIVRHRHRRDYAQLRTQITNNGVGLVSYWVRTAFAYPDERSAILHIGLWWLWYWNIRRLLLSFVRPSHFPRDLILAEFKGYFIGLNRYQKAKQKAAQIIDAFGPMPQTVATKKPTAPKMTTGQQPATAIRAFDLTQPLQAITNVADYAIVRVFVMWQNRPLGQLDIDNDGQPISVTRLREAIVKQLGLRLLDPDGNLNQDEIWSEMLAVLTQHYLPADDETRAAKPDRLPVDIPVSVVVATLDRPDDLRECLHHLTAQISPRPIEIVIVDNNPASGLTPPVVAEFPGVVLVNEPRRGLAYARNAGFTASTGAIVVTTDDDVRMSPDWLEKLVTPFERNDVMIVTGNTLPLELETPAQRLFEQYGGLGRGFKSREVNGEWFEAKSRKDVPTWTLGATANAAFRATIFSHPQIGLMDEALGPGMPSGVGEDTYLFYKVLKAGYTLVYEPSAYVWHRHRADMPALRRQIYNYSKGHVAYHLTTLFRDHDLRALLRLVHYLPRWHFKQTVRQIKRCLGGEKPDYPFSFILLEIRGNLAGPWALWQSRRRVKREGRSQSYMPVSQRVTPKQVLPLTEALQPGQVIPQSLTSGNS